jgi:hypothetical protein
MLHNVAPVATGVADTDEKRLDFGFGFVKGVLPPRKPVHGVIRVLLKIGAFLVNQPVWFNFKV